VPDILFAIAFAVVSIGISVGFALQYWNHPDRVAKRRITAMPLVPIADVSEGDLVRISGAVKVDRKTVLEAPLTGRRCAGYVVEVFHATHRRDEGTVELVREQQLTNFVLEDATGSAHIDTFGAELVLVRDRAESISGTLEPGVRAQHLLDDHGIESKGFLLQKNLMFREGILAPNEKITVVGKARREGDLSSSERSGYRDSATQLVLTGGGAGVLMISDDPKTVGPG